MTCANLFSVKAYGEFEFWFALIKVVTIIFLIFTGVGMIVFGLGNDGIPVGISNLTEHGGFLPHGIGGVFDTMLMVLFAYVGIEIIGVTAGEAADPEKNLSAAGGYRQGSLSNSFVLCTGFIDYYVHLSVGSVGTSRQSLRYGF